MAQIYRNRWKVVGSLGGGGQSDVFRVEDLSEQHEGQFALKRLRDIERLPRFRSEIDALQRLAHPNIVKLIDTSDLTDDAVRAHFLVMPIASAGDATKRLPLFKGNTETVLRVGSQIAQALASAHEANVIHRDVKPGNILFPDESLEVWLSDFGICKVDERSETPPGNIVGPRRFSAPEIEAANSNELTPSVDIYSLGQLMFFLLSGGRTFHRENVFSDEWASYFAGGEREAQLRILLSRMVAPFESRHKSMREVSEKLLSLDGWGTRASAGLVPDQIRSQISLLRERIIQDAADQLAAANAATAAAAYLEATTTGILALIGACLRDTATAFGEAGGEVTANVTEADGPKTLVLNHHTFELLGSANLDLTKLGENEPYRLSFWVAKLAGVVTRPRLRPTGERPEKRSSYYILPVVRRMRRGEAFNTFAILDGRLFALPRERRGQIVFRPTSAAPQASVDSIFPRVSSFGYELDDWPENQQSISEFVTSGIVVLLDAMTAKRIG